MNLATLQRSFPENVIPPVRLSALLEFQNRSRTGYSGYFELTEWEYGNSAWFGDEIAAKQFIVFGQGGDGSLYALWLYAGQSIADAPVVFLGSEGTDCGLLAGNLDEFLSLLAVGSDDLGFEVSWGNVIKPKSPAVRLEEFQTWLRESFGITAPNNPMSVVAAARGRHPDFGEWLTHWQALH